MRLFFAGFELDSVANLLKKDGVVIRLHPQPFRALMVLVTRAGELVTREELRHAIWSEGTHVDFERGLNTCIRQIRAALTDDSNGPQLIETISGLGYRLAVPVRQHESHPAPVEAPAADPVEAIARAAPRNALRWSIAAVSIALAFAVIALSLISRSTPPAPTVQPSPAAVAPHEFLAPGQPRGQGVDLQTLYLRGHAMFERGGRPGGGTWTALRLFERAAALNPSFAPAHVGLAEAYINLAVFDPSSRTQSIAKARAGVERAFALDNSVAEAYVASAEVRYRLGRDVEGAERDFLRAIDLDPADTYIRQRYSAFLSRLERTDEALAQVRIAQAADPLSLGSRWHITNILAHTRQYDECVDEAREALAVDPTYDLGFTALGKCLQGQGKLSDAIEAFVLGGRRALGYLGYAYAVAGRQREALDVLATLENSPPDENQEYDIARIQVGLGRRDAALTWLTKAHDRGVWLGRLRYEEAWSPLQSEALFRQYLSELK